MVGCWRWHRNQNAAVAVQATTSILLLSLVLPATSRALEPWADRSLPVKEGLLLWLDAAQQAKARQTLGYPPLRDGDRLGMLLEASGSGRHFAQRRQESQPKWNSPGESAAIEFDGQDDCLTLDGQRLVYRELTIFLVAAPRSNAGFFRGFFAMNHRGRNDYTSGISIDQSGPGSAKFDQLNAEGVGFGGVADLMTHAHAFRTPHLLSLVVGDDVSLFVDGKSSGNRGRASKTLIEIHELTLGARFYSNSREPPFLSGFLDGYVFELLMFDRALQDDERKQIESYLSAKHADAASLIAQGRAADPHAAPLTPVEDPPPVQMFVPGFTARTLPLKPGNINNVKYRDDGKLVALGYDGRIWLLEDSDGDRLEDKAEPFWDRGGLRSPIGMALTPPEYEHGEGVFVASKGKLSLIVDQNGDDRADREIIVAEGWPELPHGVDALGVAVAEDGSIYFGLGTTNFTNAYLVENGKAAYDVNDERGTILRVSPDFKQREIVCTGIRFPVAMAFNRHRDLFATDQEGATWLPNGNPFDELLHIQPDRHYGFPPRHPKHLPGVIDEPSVFDYSPQHQSTCGLNFNTAPAGRPIFGPAWWRDDALICGYSRGKLFRTKLVKSESGYVAQSAIIGCLNMLPADACISPEGDLVIAVHSGQPDWGTGPQGQGALHKIFHEDRDAPQPVFAWPAGPQEVRIAFDRPLSPSELQGLVSRLRIEYGRHVRAGDRFESLRPGYQVVQDQLLAPRKKLTIHGVSLSQDRTNLLVATDVHPQSVYYAMTFLGAAPSDSINHEDSLPQHDAIDLDYSLHGVEATWTGDGGESLAIWLPHLDLAVARELTAASPEHRAFFERIAQPGSLTLRTQLNLAQLLRPAVQPGSQIDYSWPVEKPTLTLTTSAELRGVKADAPWATVHRERASAVISAPDGVPEGVRLPLELHLATGPSELDLDVWNHTVEDARPRALPLVRFFVPWAPGETATEQPLKRQLPPELADGDWLRGRDVFYNGNGQCAACHAIDGQGGRVGPDLANLRQRDYASVLRDIATPSAAINPEHVTYAVHLTDGRVLSGAVRTEGDRLQISFTRETPSGRTVEEVAVSKKDVEVLQPLAASIMPDGLVKSLGGEAMKHLLTFLLAAPPEELRPAPIERPGAPAPRNRAQVQAVLDSAPQPSATELKPLRILLVAGPKDHGVNEHDYPQWQNRWSKLLAVGENVQVTTADSWPTAQQWLDADVAVFYSANPAWAPEKAKEVDAFQARGGGLVFLHYAVNGQRAPEELAERIGLAWQGGASKFRHGDLTLDFALGRDHPILAAVPPKANFTDESYWQLVGDTRRVNILATGVEEGAPQPLLWTYQRGEGRVFCSILGHYSWTFDDPLFRTIVLRAIAWTARQPVDRLTGLAMLGARVAD